MKLKYTAQFLFAFAIFATSFATFAEDKKGVAKKLTNSEMAKKILAKSEKVMMSDNVKINSQGIMEMITFFKKRKDGVVCMKFETYLTENNKKKLCYIIITIGGEYWTIVKDYALKKPTQTYSQEISDPVKYKKPDFKFKKAKVDDENCYIVSEIINVDDPLLPKIRQTIIREKDFVEVGTADYDKNGKLLRSTKNKVIFKDLDDNIFEVPKDKTIKTFQSYDEYSNFLHELTKAKYSLKEQRRNYES